MNGHQRFRRTEELLGGPIDSSLTDESFEWLVAAQIAEADDLEFKAVLYRRSTSLRTSPFLDWVGL